MVGHLGILLLVPVLFLSLPQVSVAQSQAATGAITPRGEGSKPAQARPLLPLRALAPVSTDELARQAAKQSQLRADSKGKKASPEFGSKSKEANPNGVLEFQLAGPNTPADSDSRVFGAKNRKKSPLGGVHGSIYGATGQGAGASTGGQVGTGNKKYDIFVGVGTGHPRSPAPH